MPLFQDTEPGCGSAGEAGTKGIELNQKVSSFTSSERPIIHVSQLRFPDTSDLDLPRSLPPCTWSGLLQDSACLPPTSHHSYLDNQQIGLVTLTRKDPAGPHGRERDLTFTEGLARAESLPCETLCASPCLLASFCIPSPMTLLASTLGGTRANGTWLWK